MKMNIKITKQATGIYTEDEVIIDIYINNGNWRYWENYFENNETQSLTINNICKSNYLSQPVKNAYPIHDHDLLKKTGELQVTGAMVRTYDSLIDYLNHRINHVKEDYKKHGWDEREFTIVLYDLTTKLQKDIVKDIVYEKEGLCKVEIRVVE